MRGAVLVAITAAIGNMLQGVDNATIAGAVMYIKREFHLETQPAVEGLVVATSLIGATIITTFSGPVADIVGRRPMLIASSLLYFLGGLVMLWSPNVYVLLIARLIDGFGVGLAVTLVPVYISETAPPEIRGLLNTFPQFTGSAGMFMAYCMIFTMTLHPGPSWRTMLGVLAGPSLIYLALTVFYLPESPRWLVSKGRMKEARVVLEKLRGREDVSGEMALLVEGLGSAGETEIEEYVVGPADGDQEQRDTVTLYGPEQGLSWVAQPVAGGRGSMLGSALGLGGTGRQGSMFDSMRDPVVALLGSVHERLPGDGGAGSMRGSTLFPNLGSMLSVERPGGAAAGAPGGSGGAWDEENAARADDEDDEYLSDDDEPAAAPGGGGGLEAPLLSRQSTEVEGKTNANDPRSQSMQRFSSMGGGVDAASTMGIGGGWQLAWKWTEKVGPDGVKRGGVKRMYLHEEGIPGGANGAAAGAGGPGEYVHAAALVSQSMLYTKDVLIGQSPTEPAFANPPEAVATKAAASGPRWRELLEPGVRHALFCGMMIQILQQFSGINGVLYYTPQILDQAGVSVLLAGLGLSADSTSILISGLTTLLMMPSIGLAMWLMDLSGRRTLLLTTIPVLIFSLVILIVANVVPMATTVHAALSTGSVIIYFCCFVMGFGPIPNILCAEIFPTRVRGLCIALCSLTFWIGDIIVTYSLPVMLNSIGLAGVFGIYACVCCLALVFVALKVPETKGLPLEVIIEFFNVGAKGIPEQMD
ncbi:monosaccharide-sensing protein 2 [Aegilops tauschii subsp. strangulata]|uniref:Major facilitator superfamily (MFS) profile domain-containing protein n=1 Tax=Aegilops tauschii subsp. strangulata TaxID=200361 RepID=A0A453TC98_AEGTS|nr:monosaccharide-sensing protein 2 [Aegilops tauschii subsp. strangulata]